MIGPAYASAAAATVSTMYSTSAARTNLTSVFGFSVVNPTTTSCTIWSTSLAPCVTTIATVQQMPMPLVAVECKYCGTFTYEQNISKCQQCAAPLPR